jgi:hypothetical protein
VTDFSDRDESAPMDPSAVRRACVAIDRARDAIDAQRFGEAWVSLKRAMKFLEDGARADA